MKSSGLGYYIKGVAGRKATGGFEKKNIFFWCKAEAGMATAKF